MLQPDFGANLAALAFGYLLGSIPFGVLISWLGGAGDLRSIGSGNIGATNVLRTGRKGLAALTLLGDMLKGTCAVLIAGQFGAYLAILAGLGAFLGHLYPVWLKFKGGKGVATYLGCLLGLSLTGAAAFGAVWLAVAALTRYSSAAALAASVVAPATLWGTGATQAAELFVALTILLWFKHWPNISRLMEGTESRIGERT